MEKMKKLLTSKAFWTLVAAIVAALTAFFTSSCSSAVHVIRHGVHVDTVQLDYQAKTKNFQSVCRNDFRFSTGRTPEMSVHNCCEIYSASAKPLTTTVFRFGSDSALPSPHLSSKFLTLCERKAISSNTIETKRCSEMCSITCSSRLRRSSPLYLATFIPAVALTRSRRGKGRPKGKGTKVIRIGSKM